MGIKFNRNKKKKNVIKGTGDDFILEQFEIYYDETSLVSKPSIIHYDPNLIVSELKTDPSQDYKLVKKLGEGAFGKVDLVEHKVTGMIRAMKIIKKKNVLDDQTNEASVLNELNILKKIDHQNVVKIYEFYSDNKNFYLITEYCPGGDLYEATKNENLSEFQVACIIYQVLLAINHIHKLKIMHRDLKLENILVTKVEEDGLYRIKLCDFGTSHLFKDGEKQKGVTGSSYYIAPEVYNGKYNFKCDLWSVGVIMYTLLTKKIPFFGKDDKEVRKSIVKKKYNPEPIQVFSQYVQDLIADLLEKNSDKRLNAEKALSYQFFKVYKCKETINKVDPKEMKYYFENMKKYKRNNIFQETAISYLIHNCDIDDVPVALKIFNLFDTYDNGKISFSEFYDSYCKLSGETISKEEGRKIFLNVDSNKNNYIEQEEFVKASIDKKVFLSEKMLRFAFNFFDIDNSGLITLEDIKEIFKDNVKRDKEAASEFNKILNTVDKDKNGKIDFEEFRQFMESLLNNL